MRPLPTHFTPINSSIFCGYTDVLGEGTKSCHVKGLKFKPRVYGVSQSYVLITVSSQQISDLCVR